MQMTHPEVEVLASEGDEEQRLHTGRIIPLYHTTAKMKSERMTARSLRRLLFAALDTVGEEIVDPLPDDIRERCGVANLREAIEKVHFPDAFADVDAARHRLAFDEIFYIQLY